MTVSQAGLWDASWGVARQGKESPWLHYALHLSGLTLLCSLQAPAPESVQGRRSPLSVQRSLFSVLWIEVSPKRVILLPFLASVTLWGRKQKPRGWVMEINYLDFSPGPVSFRKGTSLFIYLTSVVCSWVSHCIKGSRDSLVRKIESRRLEYIMCKQNFYGTLHLNGRRRSWHITCGFCEVQMSWCTRTLLAQCLTHSRCLLTAGCLLMTPVCLTLLQDCKSVWALHSLFSSRRNQLKPPLRVSPSL